MMSKDEITEILMERVCVITFKKATTGEVSTMKCTLKSGIVPPPAVSDKSAKPKNPDLLHVYSVDRAGWRSFYPTNLIGLEVLPA